MAYSKKDWTNGETITEAALDNIENGIAANDAKNTEQDGKIQQGEQKDTQQDGKISTLEGKVTALEAKTQNANKSTAGIVKQCAKVPEAAGANPTKAEFKALLDALIAAGIMASS